MECSVLREDICHSPFICQRLHSAHSAHIDPSDMKPEIGKHKGDSGHGTTYIKIITAGKKELRWRIDCVPAHTVPVYPKKQPKIETIKVKAKGPDISKLLLEIIVNLCASG